MLKMNQSLLLFISTLLLECFFVYSSPDCALNPKNPYKVAYTIVVDQSGHGNFTTVQKAIDSIPGQNNRWIRVQISPGKYMEQVVIPYDKPCIFLEGSRGQNYTIIESSGPEMMNKSGTITSYPDNILMKGITFKNTHNIPPVTPPVKQALAAEIHGDKSVFYECSFYGLQDTLWDATGRHYFYKSYIEGGIDFIFGYAQSIYEDCTINVNMGVYEPQLTGYITANGRVSAKDTSGFVFKSCRIGGSGKAYLGRAWSGFSRVIIVNSVLSDVVVPLGWDSWNYETILSMYSTIIVEQERILLIVCHG
ncbi:probable pectinesterase 29 [Tripterygium wilfordii]|uniref:probable pectinesterase 29 n=1 Tax=Tripterygium wilfordii TaxID=458696 RepID=UPI0018F8358C|nr:probable pectinesterase 29 [Tripterygium wilfordii]